jgi:dTDP-4-dehydrorhamnose 3,5-epimerase
MLEGFQRSETKICGCLRINPRVRRDERGSFVKIFHADASPLLGDEFTSEEEFYSSSRQRVLRGLHFQRPPAEAAKLVHCVQGRIMDVVVDLRVGSPTFGQHAAIEMCGDRADMLYVPAGLAHGFYVISPEAVVLYKSSRAYSPQHDMGIHWASAGIAWPDPEPIVSARDRQFVPLAQYRSPFLFPNPGEILYARVRTQSPSVNTAENPSENLADNRLQALGYRGPHEGSRTASKQQSPVTGAPQR